MLELLIGDNFKIFNPDRYNFVIEQKKVRTEGENIGEEYWTRLGHYSEIGEVIFKDLVQHGLKANDLKDVRQIITCLESIRKDILKLDFREIEKKLKFEKPDSEDEESDDMLG